jgi:hypothetical protein
MTIESALQAAIAALTEVMRTCGECEDIITASKAADARTQLQRRLALLQQRQQCAPKQ